MSMLDRFRKYAINALTLPPALSTARAQPVPKAKDDEKHRALGGELSASDPRRLFPRGITTPYNPDVLVTKKGYQAIDEMRRDEQIKAALKFKKYAVLAAGWSVAPPEGKPDDWEPLVFVREMLSDMEGTFERTLLEIMTAVDYGFSVSEIMWEQTKDAKLKIKALKTRRPDDWEFLQDGGGNVVGLRQQNTDMPLDKFVVYSYDYEFGNPYGTPDVTAAYRAWWLKKNAYNWMAMLLERLGIPPIFALYNPNDYPQQKMVELASVMKNLQAASTGAIPRPKPESLEMWSPELAGQVSTVFIPAMEWLDQNISRALLMPGLIGMGGEASGETGSLARASVHFDVFMLVLEHLRKELAQRVVQEQVICPVLELNFGEMSEQDHPKFQFLPLTDQARTEIFTMWKDLVSASVVKPQESDEVYIRKSLDFPEINPAEQEARAKEAMDKMAAQAEIEAKNAPPKPGEKPGEKPGDKQYALTDEQFERMMEDLIAGVESLARD